MLQTHKWSNFIPETTNSHLKYTLKTFHTASYGLVVRPQCPCFVYFTSTLDIRLSADGFGYGYGRKWAISFGRGFGYGHNCTSVTAPLSATAEPRKTGFGRSLSRTRHPGVVCALTLQVTSSCHPRVVWQWVTDWPCLRRSRSTRVEQSSWFCPSVTITGRLQTTAENSPVFVSVLTSCCV